MSRAHYVYAIASRDAPLPAGPAGGAVELAMVPWRELAAVTGRVQEGGPPLSMDAVLRHEAVVEAVRRRGPALPVRFGTVFRDERSLAAALAERYEPLAADLARLGDKVELSLTALWAASPSGETPHPTGGDEGTLAGRSAGAHYLHARAAELRRDDALRERAEAVDRELEQVLGGLALERRRSLLPTPGVAVRAAYLLEPAAVGAFRAAFQTIEQSRGERRLLLSGPWPPYSFVNWTQTESAASPAGRFTALAQLLTDAMGGRRG